MCGMDFRFLGPLEVANDGRLLPLGGPKQRALLATLLVRANEVVSREQAIDSVWADAPPERAVNALQVHVHGLRRALGHDRIAAEGAGYLLRADAGEVDARRFAQLYDEGRTALERRRAPRGPEPGERVSALAWRAARGSVVDLVRRGDPGPVRRAALAGARAAHRSRAGTRSWRGADCRAAGTRGGASVSRAPTRPADARALPVRATERGARRLRKGTADARRRARARAGRGLA